MAMPERTNQISTLEEAKAYVSRFQNKATEGAIRGGAFWKEYVQKILDQPDCVALRYYFGENEDGSPTIVLVGVDSEWRDQTDGTIVEMQLPCPPYCQAPNELND